MRLIDADAIKNGKFHSNESWSSVEQVAWQWGWNDAIDAIINGTPTVDAVKVVRCKDCKWHEDEEPSMVWCPYVVGSWVGDDGYCSFGERKDEVTE